MSQLEAVKTQFFDAAFPFDRSPIANPHIGYLWQFSEDNIAAFFDLSQLSVLEQVPESLIFFVHGHIVEALTVYRFFAGIDGTRLGSAHLLL